LTKKVLQFMCKLTKAFINLDKQASFVESVKYGITDKICRFNIFQMIFPLVHMRFVAVYPSLKVHNGKVCMPVEQQLHLISHNEYGIFYWLRFVFLYVDDDHFICKYQYH
jgi:hypothetical protein